MPKPGSGKSAPKSTTSSGGKEKKEKVIQALVPKPNDSFVDNSRDPRAAGNKSYYEAKSHNPLDKGRTAREAKETGRKVIKGVTDLVTGGMTKDERKEAASRTQGAEDYQSEQQALLDAAKERERKENEQTYADRRAREKAIKEAGKKAEAAYKPYEEQERFAEDARRYSAVRNAEREREAAAEGTAATSSRANARAAREEERAKEDAEKAAAAATPGVKEEAPSAPNKPTKPTGGWASFIDDDDGEDGVEEEETFFPTSDEPLPSEVANSPSRQDLIAKRDALQEQYAKLYTLINSTGLEGHDFDASAYDRLDALDQQVRELNRQIGIESRVGNTLVGATGQYVSGLTNAAGTALDAIGAVGGQYGNASPYAGYATDQLSADAIGTGTEAEKQAWAAEMQRVQTAAAEVQAAADSLSESAAKDLTSAKDGLSGLGAAGVDIATNIIQMGYDAALGRIPGVSPLLAMFLRSAGGASQEARQEGASVGEQLAYGVTKGAIEVATEKLFDGVAGIFGKGAADDVVEGAIRRLAETDTGRTVLRVLAGAGGEGAEEAISDLLAPFAEQIYNDEALRDLWENGYDGSEILYDFLIGAAIGGLGSAGSIATGQDAAKNAEAREADAVEARVNEQMNGVMDALTNSGRPQPVEGLAGEDQRAEQMQQRQQAPDEILADAATPKPEEGKRNTTGEERAERAEEEAAKKREEAKEQKQEQEREEEPEAEEETPPAEEQPQPEPQTPAEILADAATPKSEETGKESEENGEKQETEAPKTPEEKRSRAAELRSRASKLWDEIEMAENNHSGEDSDSAAYYEELGAEAERLEAEAEALEKEAEEDELWGNSEAAEEQPAAKGPAEILVDEAAPKGERAEGPSEAAESKIPEGDESVPEGTPKATSEAPAELNNGLNPQNESDRIEADIKQANEDFRRADSTQEQRWMAHLKAISGYDELYSKELKKRRAAGEEGLPDVDDYVGRARMLNERADSLDPNSAEYDRVIDELEHVRYEAEKELVYHGNNREEATRVSRLAKLARVLKGDLVYANARERLYDLYDALFREEKAAIGSIYGPLPSVNDFDGRLSFLGMRQTTVDNLRELGLISEKTASKATERIHTEEEFLVYRQLDKLQKAGENVHDYIEQKIDALDQEINMAEFMRSVGALSKEEADEAKRKYEEKKNRFVDSVNKWLNGGGQELSGKAENSKEPGSTAVEPDSGRGKGNSGKVQKPKQRRGNPALAKLFKPRTAQQEQTLREKVKKGRENFRKECEQEIAQGDPFAKVLGLPDPQVVDVNSLPDGPFKRQWQHEIESFKKKHLDCEIITVRDGNFGPAYATRYNKQFTGGMPTPGAFAIVLDLDETLRYIAEEHVTVEQVLLHEMFHAVLGQSGYDAVDTHAWFKEHVKSPDIIKALLAARDCHAKDFHHSAHWREIARDVKGSADNIDLNDQIMSLKDDMWNEVFADLLAHLDRAFKTDGKTNPHFNELCDLAKEYYDTILMPAYRYMEGIDSYEGMEITPDIIASAKFAQSRLEAADGGAPDPGENASWSGSLKRQNPPPENTEVEQPGDDMTPLNDISREQDEERREKQKAETKKRLGTENHKRLSDALDRLEKWKKEYNERYGELSRDEHGGIIQDEDGNDIKISLLDDFTKNLRATLEGEQTIQSFQEYYESLRPKESESKATDANYFYDPAVAEMLNQFGNAERELIYAEKGGPANADKAVRYGEGPSKEVAKENYDKQSEAFSLVLAKRMERLEDSFKERTTFNGEVTENAKGENTGLKNWLERQSKRFWQSQMRPDTFFKMLGGFYEKGSKAAYSLAKRAGDSLKTRTTVRNNAMSKFNELTESKETKKAWKGIEQGKTKSSVKVPGIKGEASMNTALALLKTLMTNGSLDHIARFGAQFVNESDYYKGYNNNGMGETESYRALNRLTRDALDQMATENLKAADEKITGKKVYDEKIRILKELRGELMRDVMSNPAAKAAYEASIDAMEYLADELNGTTLKVYGIAKALQGSNYWPMTVIGQGNNLQFINNTAFTMEDASFLQHRQGGSGALMIKPFTETMTSYMDRASRFVGFGELNSDLMMMSKEIGVGHGEHDAEKQSIQSVIEKQAGKSAAEWMERYIKTLNGLNKNPGGLGAKIRSNLASSSLSLNPGVALKQSPSYLNAAGVIDLDILLKNRLVTAGALRTAKSYENDPLLAEINKRTGILESRKSGTVAIGEAGADGRALFGNLKRHLPPWITNRDVSTVSNLALACAEQVKRNNPGIDTNSDEFYQKTAELLEEATIKTQPIYDPEFRADYLRSESEIVRMMSMFRTQQSQNFNQLMQAYGEMAAAKARGSEAEQKAASKKARQVTAGYAMSQAAFAVLSSAAKLLMHKTKDYEDEDGNFNFGKLAKRFGLDFLTTGAGAVWFGDTVAKAALDLTTNAVTGGKGTSEFYKLSDNTISTVDSMISSVLNFAKNPSAKTAKNAVFDLSQGLTGLPARNAYNIVNSVIMYGEDIAKRNHANSDDIADMLQRRSKMSESSRATETTEAAVRAYMKGDRKRGNTLLSTLDTSSSDVRSAIRKAAGDAYVAGDIDEMTYRGILRNYGGVEVTKIDDTVHQKELDKVIAALTETDPKRYEGVIREIDDVKDHLKTGESSSNAAAQVILDAAMDNKGTDAFMERYTSSGYFTAYEALRDTYKPKMAVDLISSLDANKDDRLAQEELYNYYLENPSSKNLIKTVWNANGFSQNWDTYLASKSKREDYDRLSHDNAEDYQFGSAEKTLKDLKSGATITFQNQTGDPAMYKVIDGMKLSDKDADIVVDRYVSGKNKKNYHVLRDAGFSPKQSFELLTTVDTDGKGTLSQKEIWDYYKGNKDDEAVIEALWNSQGYTGKNSSTWKKYKKSKRK